MVIQPKKPFAIDISKINKRVEELNPVREQKPYEWQKTALEVELSGFLASLPFPKNSEVGYCPRYHQVSGMEGQERSH